MESNPSQMYREFGGMNGTCQQEPFSLLLNQDPGAAASAGGLLDPTPCCEALTLSGLNGLDGLPMDAEEPGPLPCLPKMNRMVGPYASHSSLLMQQQQLQHLQRCGYPPTGAPGASGRQGRPRRHSVTIGMLNENQQAVLAAAAAQLPPGWAQPPGSAVAGGGQFAMLQQPSPQNKQLPGLNMQNALQQGALQQASLQQGGMQQNSLQHGGLQHSSAAAQFGLSQSGLGQAYGGAGRQLQQHQLGSQTPSAISSSSNSLSGLAEFPPPAYGMNAPRMPGRGNSRRHSWAPMGAESSMAYARQCLLLQQQQLQQHQQRSSNYTAQLGDAGALFVNQQQQDQLGLSVLGGLAPLSNCLGPADLGGLAGRGMLGGDSDLGSGSNPVSLGQPAPGLPLYGDLAKEQLAQHLQQQLQQLQLQQQQQGVHGRLPGSGRALDPFAEPFVRHTGNLVPAMGGLGGNLGGMDPYTAALQQELLQQQQQQTALAGLQFDDASLTAAAASMYAPLQVNGVSVDTQLLVAPYADNWDVLGQSSSNALSGGSFSANPGAMSALGGNMASQPSMQSMGSFNMSKPKAATARTNSGNIGSNHTSPLTSAGPPNSNSSKAATPAGQSAAAAAAAAASMVASLPPLSKVCSDVPWDLRKAAEEDAKTLTLQRSQLLRLAAALEHSRTLQQVHAAAAQAAEASKAGAGGAKGTADAADSAHSLFGYQLPDSGTDTWGGGVPAALPGGSCISQDPSNKLFVGNIGWWVTEEDLLHWFSRFGTVVNVKVSFVATPLCCRSLTTSLTLRESQIMICGC